jgi:hypothetical protein
VTAKKEKTKNRWLKKAGHRAAFYAHYKMAETTYSTIHVAKEEEAGSSVLHKVTAKAK